MNTFIALDALTLPLLRVRKRGDWPFDEFSEYLTLLRNRAGITTDKQLAEAAGIYPSYMTRWRSGELKPSQESLKKVAKALGVRPGDLWVMAGLVDADDLNVAEGILGPTLPPELQELLDLYADPRINESERETLLTSARMGVATVRSMAGPRLKADGRSTGRSRKPA